MYIRTLCIHISINFVHASEVRFLTGVAVCKRTYQKGNSIRQKLEIYNMNNKLIGYNIN
jgi:hypothetical protein